MRQLAEALEEGQQPLLALDLKAIESSNARQQALCDELNALQEPWSAGHRQCCWTAEGGCPCVSERVRDHAGPNACEHSTATGLAELRMHHPELITECVAMEKRVRHLNLVYAALLRKTRQSFAVLSNLLSTDALTYAKPECDAGVKSTCANPE